MPDEKTLRLADGRLMPRLGLGAWRMSDQEAAELTRQALAIGYRLIDTASYYRNEAGIGRALADSGLGRDEYFITTKVWVDEQGYERTLKAAEDSLKRLGLDYVDLYLIHWPVAGLVEETWRALEELRRRGMALSIGVSNLNIEQLAELLKRAEAKPVINQVELHPALGRPELRKFCAGRHIAVEAFAPLARGEVLNRPEITAIAEKYGRTAAQIVLRWELQLGLVTIPKSARPERLRENFDVFGFSLSDEDMAAIEALDRHATILTPPLAFDTQGYVTT